MADAISSGPCWTQKGNYSEAIKYHTGALKASFKNGRKILTLISYQGIGNCYMNLGNYQEALKNYQLVLKTLSQINYPEESQERAMQEFTSLGIGDVYAKLHNYPEALFWYEKVLKDRNYPGEAVIRTKMALVQMEMNNNDEALKNLQAPSALS